MKGSFCRAGAGGFTVLVGESEKSLDWGEGVARVRWVEHTGG